MKYLYFDSRVLTVCLFVFFFALENAPSAEQAPVNKENKTKLKTDENLEQKKTLEELKSIQEQINLYTNISFEFEQKVYKSLRKKFIESQGKASFAKPNHFRWEFKKPRYDEWTYNGAYLFYIEHQKKSYTRYLTSHQVGKELLKIVEMIFSSKTLLDNYDLIEVKRNQKISILITLKPKEKSDISFAQLEYDLQKKFIQKITLNWVKGKNYTIFTIKNSALSKKNLAKEKTSFLPPKSYKGQN